ncbi:MAG: selenocysteine-specific translation elongation factor [Alphaproteobacteria bacterium]|nr:selenocysteine-specific translation elongation factor [Alphaproteobacteria bacterium]
MIVATAGHIDHGKTQLVKALTGVDADRLPEEKQRGLTIDLGFAYMPAPDGSVLGFVDVPGHERFIRNMIAGVTGIDGALLVVAADDGPMPQTAEHLAILDLLGVSGGVVALTKIDRVSAERVAEVAEAVRRLISGTVLDGAEIVPVCAPRGEGIAALRRALEAAGTGRSRAETGNFRLAVDRCFTVPGAGVVVTGAVFSGTVKTGDRLMVSPSGIPVRVRGIHAQNRQSESGMVGQRCALNLTSAELERGDISRGQWVLAPEVHAPTRRMDGRLRVLPGEARPLRHWTPVHLHLGAAEVPARVAVLEGGSIAPGEGGLVQLVLEREIGALRGDRFILRDQSARRTIAGGGVIDPFAPARGRARPERIALIGEMEREPPEAALEALLRALPGGVDLGWFQRSWNLRPADAEALWGRAVPRLAGGGYGFEGDHWRTIGERITAVLGDYHARNKASRGIAEEALRRQVARGMPKEAFSELIGELCAGGTLAADGGVLRLARHHAELAPADAALWKKLAPAFEAAGLRPPSLAGLAEEAGTDRRAVEGFLVRAARLGLVVRIAEKSFLLPDALERLGAMAEEIAEADGALTIKALRDKSGIGRNVTIEVAEYFDRVGFTYRRGNEREIRKAASEVNWLRQG